MHSFGQTDCPTSLKSRLSVGLARKRSSAPGLMLEIEQRCDPPPIEPEVGVTHAAGGHYSRWHAEHVKVINKKVEELKGRHAQSHGRRRWPEKRRR